MNAKKKPRREIFECTHCGADVPVGAKVCRECGSDAATGWQSSEQVDYASVEIPDSYADSGAATAAPRRAWMIVVALVVALALLALTLLR